MFLVSIGMEGPQDKWLPKTWLKNLAKDMVIDFLGVIQPFTHWAPRI